MANRGVNALHFWGERQRPLQPSDLAKKDPILASGQSAFRIVQQASRRSLFISTANGKRPEVKVHQRDSAGDQRIFEIEIAHGAEQFGQINYTLPGKTAVRRPPEEILSEIDPNLDFRGKRPDFLHQLFQPRTIPRIQPWLRRFNGRHVKPNLVYRCQEEDGWLSKSD
jgi:hypothetical protein